MRKCRILLIALSFSLTLVTTANTVEIKPEQLTHYYRSETHLSPSQNALIIVDYFNREGGPYAGRAILYRLPLMDHTKGSQIIPADNYSWSMDGNIFATQKWIENGRNDNYPIKTRIVIYDTGGTELESPGFGTSPAFLAIVTGHNFFYFCELSDTGGRIPPRLIQYNIETKSKKIVYIFEPKYTFWPEQIDDLAIPRIVDWYHGGLRGVVYEHKDTEIAEYTFIVSIGGALKQFHNGVDLNDQ